MAMNPGKITQSITDGVSTITFFHPQSNSMPGKLLRELAATIQQASEATDSQVILLQSGTEDGSKAAKGAFCAGASFDELMAINNLDEGKLFFSGFAHVLNAMRLSKKFIIARVHGKAVGGGVGIAAGADYTFATQFAEVKLSELAVGIGPFVVGPAVERKIGTAAFSELSMDATNWRSAEWALQKGLYANVSKSSDEMDLQIAALIDKLKASNPGAMQELKKIFWEGTDHWADLLLQRASISGKLVLSEFTRNAIQQFKKS
jgi:methylglutaconyl-CoA hydratase